MNGSPAKPVRFGAPNCTKFVLSRPAEDATLTGASQGGQGWGALHLGLAADHLAT